jgi:hypothetical protein
MCVDSQGAAFILLYPVLRDKYQFDFEICKFNGKNE